MYMVYCDSLLMYHSKLESLKIFDASVELELNKTGSFLFTVYPEHPHYALIRKMKSIITVYQDDYLLFRGRVLNDTIGFYNEKHIECEGELSFLLDTIKRPFTFTGTSEDFFRALVADHNAQADSSHRFTVGVVALSESKNLDIEETEYLSIWSLIEKHLIGSGFITTRHENGTIFIDYTADSSLIAPQTVTFGSNLLDMKRIRKGEDIATAVIPVGKDGINITAVNGGLDYVADAEAIAQYGFIVKSVKFDEITDASALKTAGEAYLAGLVNLTETIELDATDMATVESNFSSFHLGTYVRVTSNPHGINQLFLVKKLSINLLEPASNKLTFGKSVLGFSEAVKGISDGQSIILQEIEKSVKTADKAVIILEQNFNSAIQQTEQNIQMSVAENFYLKDQTDALVSSVSTEIEQTKNSFEIQFNSFSADLQAVASGADAEFEEIKKYIRFIDGKILLGEIGNELELQIANDRISFLQDSAEVAYFSNRKLYVTDSEILNSMKIGNYAFMPRANGNLSFKKVNTDSQNVVGFAVVDMASAV